MRIIILIEYIVTCGLLLLLVYLATNTIWLSLIITPILCGLFLCTLNLTLFPLCQMFWLMSSHSLAAPSKPSNARMVVRSIMLHLTLSSSSKGYFCGCLVHTLLCRTVKPSASFTPLIICSVPYFLVFYSDSLLGRRAPHRHISAEPPPHQGDQHGQSILRPPWSRPIL
jgi:hypothetical protein